MSPDAPGSGAPLRVAVVNQFSSAGGGSRFARALVLALAEADPRSTFDLFADDRAIERDALVELFAPHPNVRVVPLGSAGTVTSGPRGGGMSALGGLREWGLEQPALVRAYRWLKFDVLRRPQAAPSTRLPDATLRALEGYDVVYLAWPYFIEPFTLSVPVVATFHDFNFKHDFGNFTPEMRAEVERDTEGWLTSPVQPISSSQFIADELRHFYPDHAKEPVVVYLSTFAVHDPSEADVAQVRAKHGLPARYVVCPSNTAPHKNLVNLFRALGQLKREGRGVPLVLTGFGTDDLRRLASGQTELRARYESVLELHRVRVEEGLELDRDVFALGFVSDIEMDALIRGARAVLAPSRYEAGSGPGVDAWKLGTLVISSNIPPVLQQLDFLGTAAYLFGPDDPASMARVIDGALADPDAARQMVEQSSRAMAAYTWTQVAEGYLRVFRSVVSEAGGTVADEPAQP